jgi:multiple sugar transport system ATP-binding protein
VGRAIVRKPSVFLFDEPLSNLDAKMRVQMRVEISRLHQQLGTTMIYVTHDQTEAMTMGQRIVVMKGGLVQQVAGPISLYDNPVNRFVAGFIGMPPMNFFEGTVRRAGGDILFEGPGGMQLATPVKSSQSLKAYCDKPVTLGLRPEDIGSAAAEQLPGAPRIRATVDVIEPLGSETYVYFSVAGATFVSRADARCTFRVQDVAEPAVFIDKSHFFDPGTGQRIG